MSADLVDMYHNCPDPLKYAIDEDNPEILELAVEANFRTNPGSFLVKTSQGNFRVTITVTKED